VLALATGLGSGYSPIAPGTAGSVVGLAAVWAMSGITPIAYISVCIVLFVAGTAVSGAAEKIYGAKDCGKITVDEVLGMMLSLLLLPATPFNLIAGFFLFRFFDIVKPFPARRIDARVEGGLGVMLDDVFAAVYANLCLRALVAMMA
jgi:phosphatidylglycerophosphatase A